MAKRGRGAWVRRTVSTSLGVYDAREVSLCPLASLSASETGCSNVETPFVSLSAPSSLSLGHG